MPSHDSSPLCCCEYVDIDGHRNHILACCCNCMELDALVDSVICCRGKRKCFQLVAVIRNFQDRMRIPWMGGAKRVTADTFMPFALTFFTFVLAAQGWIWMTLAFLFLISFITFPCEKYFCFTLNAPFHAKVFYSSIAAVVFIYEHYVVPQLEISFSENMIFVVFMTVAVLAFYVTQVKKNHASSGQMSEVPVWSKQCQMCNQASHSADFHSIWYGCCIGVYNRCWYLISLGSLVVALFDCSYLTLTTVCRPYELVEDMILVPEECDEVFIQWQYSICFVSGVFSLLLSGVLSVLLVRELWFISIGFTVSEWRNLPIPQKLFLGLCNQRVHDKGFIRNWLQVIKRSYV